MVRTCADFQEDLSALLDNELKGEEKTGLESHLTECKDCASRFQTLKSLSAFLKDESEPDQTDMPDLWDAVKDEIASICEVMKEDLSAYLDGELPPAAQEGVKQHLNDCGDCLDQFKLLNRTNQLLSKGLELPEDVDTDVWESVRIRLTADCEIIVGELSPYIDQEVPGARHRAITQHLVDCINCRTNFDGLTSVGDFIRTNYQPDIPEDFDLWPQIKNRMQVVPFRPKAAATPGKPKQARPRFTVVAAAAAAVIGLFATVAVWLCMPDDGSFKPVSAEAYLIESSFEEPGSFAEAVIYEQ